MALLPDPLGIDAGKAIPKLQMDCFQELVNKLAWVIGSTYRVDYSNRKTTARIYAVALASRLIQDHGYPDKIEET